MIIMNIIMDDEQDLDLVVVQFPVDMVDLQVQATKHTNQQITSNKYNIYIYIYA